jgi:hypothetical protein
VTGEFAFKAVEYTVPRERAPCYTPKPCRRNKRPRLVFLRVRRLSASHIHTTCRVKCCLCIYKIYGCQVVEASASTATEALK